MRIDAGRIINDFIEPNRRQYAIPVYQRNYEWSKEQCVKLYQDIIEAYKNDKSHFCGSIVYSMLKEEHNIQYYVIIDGQQRLTTIYILLKALLDSSTTESEKELITESLFNVDKFEKYGIDKLSKLKLKPFKSDNLQLMIIMENKMDEIDKSSGIWHNYELFKSLISQTVIEGKLTVKEIYKGIEKLICAKINLDNDENAQEIFERINSTGVPLSLADKIRNYALMTDVDQEKLYENYWIKIEQLVKKQQMPGFFLEFINFKSDGIIKDSDAYDSFKQLYGSLKYTNEQMLSEMLHYAKYYHLFLYGDSTYNDTINQSFKNLRRLRQTTLFQFLFSVFDDYANGIASETDIERILHYLINYSIRRLVCNISSSSLRGFYKTLYSRIFSIEENKKHYFDAIVSFFAQLTSKDRFVEDSLFVESLKYNNLYRKNALCKYLLVEIENEGKEQLVTDNLTIEHILPQNKNLSTEWQKMLGTDWQAVKDKYLDTLGNLTLTAYNSELGDKAFDEKKKKLSSVNSKVVTLYQDVKTCKEWTSDAIEKRADRLSRIVLKMYPMRKPDYLIRFTDPRYQEYTCENPEDASGKLPEYFILQGERISTTSFANMLRTVILRLYADDRSIIENMAANNERIVEWSQNIMFSYDPGLVSGDNKLDGTDIYESRGFSAKHIMCIIRELLDRYDIDMADFVYSARNNNNSSDEEVESKL